MTSERERPAGTVSCPACGGAAVVSDGAGELPCDECGCTGSVDAVDEVRRLRERVKHYQMQATHHAIRDLDERDAQRERAELQGAALRVVALWLGGPNHSPQPADVEELARAKGKELDAVREARESLRASMVTMPHDWALDHRFAWQYGIVVGWGEALPVVAARHGWDEATVARLTRLRAALAGEVSRG